MKVRACEACAYKLPMVPRPVLQVSTRARVLIAGCYPGRGHRGDLSRNGMCAALAGKTAVSHAEHRPYHRHWPVCTAPSSRRRGQRNADGDHLKFLRLFPRYLPTVTSITTKWALAKTTPLVRPGCHPCAERRGRLYPRCSSGGRRSAKVGIGSFSAGYLGKPRVGCGLTSCRKELRPFRQVRGKMRTSALSRSAVNTPETGHPG